MILAEFNVHKPDESEIMVMASNNMGIFSQEMNTWTGRWQGKSENKGTATSEQEIRDQQSSTRVKSIHDLHIANITHEFPLS